jgi:glutamine amidotransferase
VKAVVCDYGAGNVRSLCAALERAGFRALLSRRPREAREAPLALVAGVGHLRTAAEGLRASGVAEALRERAAAGRPLLGICVGMQLLFQESEEGGAGLGLLAGAVRRLRARRVPHMGWNTLHVRKETELLRGLDGADVYFAHSYACAPADAGLVAAETDHDGLLVAAVEEGALAGLQFHPERSGAAGRRLFRNLLAWSRSA